MGDKSHRRVVCTNCGNEGTHGGHGWCGTCASRWRAAGCPESGPPPPQDPRVNAVKAREIANAISKRRAAERRAEYIRLHNAGLDPAAAAQQLGVHVGTARIYRNQLIAEGAIMPRVRESDPNWMVGRMQAYSDRPASGRESLNDRLGAVYASDLTPDQWRHVAVVAGGILVGAGITGPGELRDMLEALGLLDYPAPVRRTNGHLKDESGHDRARKAAERLADAS